jgi:hypothetical protein
MPFEFGLVAPKNPDNYLETAAYLFQEVVKDPELMFVYGELDLRCLPELSNSKLIISLVIMAKEDMHLRLIRLTDGFKMMGLSKEQIATAITDDDVMVCMQVMVC